LWASPVYGEVQGEEERMATEKRLSEIISVRFSAAEVTHLRRLAQGRPLSQVVRGLTLSAVEVRAESPTASWTSPINDQPLTININSSDWSAPVSAPSVQFGGH
jgi:hypothetical protein